MMPQNLALVCFFLVSALFAAPSHGLITEHGSEIRGMFVFGSSVVDNGNNFLSNRQGPVGYSPYGIDFPLGPTGRFTNGDNMGDRLGKKLHLPNYIPPFKDPSSTNGTRIVHGVNYAYGGSGILDNTGPVAGNVTGLNQQIRNFEVTTLPQLEIQLRQNRSKILPKYLFVVASGGNDYSQNYFRNLNNSNVTLEAFTANLTSTLTLQLKRLYSLGARKFVLFSILPNGCSPWERAKDPASAGCVERINRAVQMYNVQLRNLTDVIRPQLPGSNLIFVNTYKIVRDIISHPILKGFHNVNSSCCELDGGLCRRGGSVCTNRREYVYFDSGHTTEAVNDVIATKAFSSNLKDEVYPFNVRKLVHI